MQSRSAIQGFWKNASDVHARLSDICPSSFSFVRNISKAKSVVFISKIIDGNYNTKRFIFRSNTLICQDVKAKKKSTAVKPQ